jgi:glycosyltransferase involved in cell wall biosynthesis
MLAQFYPPLIGGEERFVRDLSAELAARGHDISVATLWETGLSDFERDGEVRVYRIRSSMRRAGWLYSEQGRRHAPPFPDPEVTLALRKIVRLERPEIVHAHNWLLHSFLPLKTWSGAKLVVTMHDYSLVCATKKMIHRDAPCSGPGLLKCLTCASDHYGSVKGAVTTVANWAMGRIERSSVDMFLPESRAVADTNGFRARERGAPFHVLPVFVPDDVAEPRVHNEQLLKQLPDEEYLLFVGAFGRYKGVDVLLEAYSGLGDAPPLVILGYHTSEYPVQTEQLPANVHVFIDWPHGAVMEAWRHSVLGLAPSVWAEPFGLVVLEAMAAGRPVIASRIGGLVDLVDEGETGLLVPPGEALALRGAMRRLIGDPELRTRMGRAGKAKVVDFQASSVIPRLERVYADVLRDAAADHPLRASPATFR